MSPWLCQQWPSALSCNILILSGHKALANSSTSELGQLHCFRWKFGSCLGISAAFQEISFKVFSVLSSPYANIGALYINGSLDFEASHEYYLSIEGTRKGSASLSDVTMVVINITDINDHAPEFIQDPYSTDIREDAAIGEIILTV